MIGLLVVASALGSGCTKDACDEWRDEVNADYELMLDTGATPEQARYIAEENNPRPPGC
jgi:hypothetical protein